MNYVFIYKPRAWSFGGADVSTRVRFSGCVALSHPDVLHLHPGGSTRRQRELEIATVRFRSAIWPAQWPHAPPTRPNLRTSQHRDRRQRGPDSVTRKRAWSARTGPRSQVRSRSAGGRDAASRKNDIWRGMRQPHSDHPQHLPEPQAP